jgi:hypothetical protein
MNVIETSGLGKRYGRTWALKGAALAVAWTQGCGRTRWAIAKLALLAVTVTVAAEAFSLLFSWYFQPWFAQGLDGGLAPQLFDLRGIDFAAWTLLAFALGVAAGALIRRTVPAMAAALATWTGLFFATFLFLRKHYQAPLVAGSAKASTPSFANNWSWAQWYTGPNGKAVSQQTIRNVVARAPASVQNSKNPNAATAYLSAHHYTQWWTYQPVSRYWHFQVIEGGWLLALSLILLAGTVWLVRNKAA